jgi:hypothetical protein
MDYQVGDYQVCILDDLIDKRSANLLAHLYWLDFTVILAL